MLLLLFVLGGSAGWYWEQTWGDEFNGALNRSHWTPKSNWTHCCGPKFAKDGGELQLYDADDAFTEDGRLVLRTRRRQLTGPDGIIYNYTSGWVDTKGHVAQRYGRFAANCSLPPRNATGIWPAFWLMPANHSQCWPTGGEVDIFEFNGNWAEDRIFASYHWAPPGQDQCGKDKAPLPGRGFAPARSGRDWQRDWHVYAVEWSPGRLDYFVDDQSYLTVTARSDGVDPVLAPDGVHLPSSPMFIIFDQAVDSWLFPPGSGPGDYAGDAGVRMMVEWVRIYRNSSNSNSSSSN